MPTQRAERRLAAILAADVAGYSRLIGPDEEREALKAAVAAAPTSFDMDVRDRVPWMRSEDYAPMLDGLRKAGWEG